MGNDGGSIPTRIDLVRTKAKSEVLDKRSAVAYLWLFCCLSKRLLSAPVVSDALGKLYNKEAVLEWMVDRRKYGDGDVVAGHLRGLKDTTELKLTPNPTYRPPSPNDADSDKLSSPFICPLTFKQMDGKYRFVYLLPCGCTFSEAGLRQLQSGSTGAGKLPTPPAEEGSEKEGKVRREDAAKEKVACPQCGKKYDPRLYADGGDMVTINPPKEEQYKMRVTMEGRRKEEKKRKKEKKAATNGSSADRADGKKEDTPVEPPAKKARALSSTPVSSGASTPTLSSNTAAGSVARKVASSMAASADAQKKARMAMGQDVKKPVSAAIADIYGLTEDGKKKPDVHKNNFLTRSTFTR